LQLGRRLTGRFSPTDSRLGHVCSQVALSGLNYNPRVFVEGTDIRLPDVFKSSAVAAGSTGLHVVPSSCGSPPQTKDFSQM
ncbi:hypothetical protein XENOCAPTIV_009469, partial [Xenoophorus captivus]